LTENSVFDATTFVFDAIHKAARPNKFGGKQTQSEKNCYPARARRDELMTPTRSSVNPNTIRKSAANLVKRGLEHDRSTNRLFEDGRSNDERQASAIPFDLRETRN